LTKTRFPFSHPANTTLPSMATINTKKFHA